jgi:hypothetical protein
LLKHCDKSYIILRNGALFIQIIQLFDLISHFYIRYLPLKIILQILPLNKL